MKYTFFKFANGDDWGWWLEVLPSEVEHLADLHKRISSAMFLRYSRNPHFKDGVLDKGPIELATRWLQTIEKLLGRGLPVYVNENGGMFALNGSRLPEPIGVVYSNRMAFPPSRKAIANRKIDIHKWYGGTHFYLQCQDKMVFSQEKFNTISEARTEAELYALPENIRLCASDFQYNREGD